jgi:hypothetical protein
MHLVALLLLAMEGNIPVRNPMPGTSSPSGGTSGQKIALDPKTPLADLLPPVPRRLEKTVDLFKVDLAKVPEVDFQEPLSHQLTKADATKAIADRLAKIRQLNDKKTDAFQQLLIAQRQDLQGLPFVLGNACRTTGNRAALFGLVAMGVRITLDDAEKQKKDFWELFETGLKKGRQQLPELKALLEGKTEPEPAKDQDCKALEQDLDAACVAALVQILAPEAASMRQGLVQFLAKTPHVDATMALARLALFSAEAEVRRPALEALKSRPKQDYQTILMLGFHYPLPEVADRAAVAVATLKHQDLVPKLVDLLDEPDPRLPTLQTVDGKKVWVVRELVRVNHHRNCMLCHVPAAPLNPPGNGDDVKQMIALVQVAPVPLPGEPLPPPSKGYDLNRESSELLVRIDTTYLRQDFSLMQAVAEETPWPKYQRFDFFVRSRVLTKEEAEQYQNQAPQPQANGNPYQQAVVSALRELTGKQAGPNAQAWRNMLIKP